MITVDEVIAGLVEENQEEQTGFDVFNQEHDENCAESIFFINDDDSATAKLSSADSIDKLQCSH